MRVLVCYDVASSDPHGSKRLRHIATVCKNYGVRVQFSVFECNVPDRFWEKLRHQLLSIYDPNQDSLRFYFIAESNAQQTEHYGIREPLDPTAPMVI